MALEDETAETWGRMKREKEAALAEKDAAFARAAELERWLAEFGRQSGNS